MRQNQKKSKKRKSKKARKPKVYIPAYKIIIFCCVIILICMTLLLVTTIKSSQRPETSSILERYEKTETKSQKNERRTENQKNSESAGDKENLQKNENQKSAEKEKNAENRQNRTKNPAQNESKKGIGEQKSQELQTQPPNQNLNQKEAENSQKKSGKAEENRNAENLGKSERKNENDEQAKSQRNERPAPAQNQNQEKNLSDSASAENSQKTTKYNFPAAKNNAQLIFVFDDGGQNLSQLDAFLKLPVPITVAVLPRLEFSKQAAQKIRDSGNEAILHQPMQAINLNVNPGLGAITPQMTDEEIISVLFYNINEIGPVAGMNNHEGSAITADAEKTAVILKVASDEGIYFLDSRTNSETKVPYVSKQLGYSYYERNIFLDNEKTKENALNELKRGLDLANKNGSVIMFGHIWSADFLPDFILEVLPELQEKGYTFCTVSKSNAIKR